MAYKSAKSKTSKSIAKQNRAVEAWVVVKGWVMPNQGKASKARFVSFQRNAKILSYIRNDAKKGQKRMMVYPRKTKDISEVKL